MPLDLGEQVRRTRADIERTTARLADLCTRIEQWTLPRDGAATSSADQGRLLGELRDDLDKRVQAAFAEAQSLLAAIARPPGGFGKSPLEITFVRLGRAVGGIDGRLKAAVADMKGKSPTTARSASSETSVLAELEKALAVISEWVGLRRRNEIFSAARSNDQAPVHIDGKSLPDKAREVLAEILRASKNSRARVTDVARGFDEQAKEICSYRRRHGSAATRELYGKGPGTKALEILEAADLQESPAVLKEMAATMRSAIAKERQSGGQVHLMHTSDTHYTFDVAPSSIERQKEFIAAVQKHPKVSRFLHPASTPRDKAYHIEVPK